MAKREMGKVVMINLSTETATTYLWSDEDQSTYFGGKLMALKLLDDLTTKTTVLQDANPIVVATGLMNGSQLPSSNRYTMASISPFTNELITSNGGDEFGCHLKRFGIDAIIITGESTVPCWIEIHDEGIDLHDASRLWGRTTEDTIKRLRLTVHDASFLMIGPAGEQLVPIANVVSEDRSFGRDGLGTVFGHKQLKAITIQTKVNKKADSKGKGLQPYQCPTCEKPCGHLFAYQGLVVKSGEINALNDIGPKVNNTNLDDLLVLKTISFRLGIDLIDGIKCVIDQVQSLDEMKQKLNDMGYGYLKVHRKQEHVKVKNANPLKEALSACGFCLLNKEDDLEISLKMTKEQLILAGEKGLMLEKKLNKK